MISSFVLWEMGIGSNFGRTDNVAILLFKSLSLLYLPLLERRRLGLGVNGVWSMVGMLKRFFFKILQ